MVPVCNGDRPDNTDGQVPESRVVRPGGPSVDAHPGAKRELSPRSPVCSDMGTRLKAPAVAPPIEPMATAILSLLLMVIVGVSAAWRDGTDAKTRDARRESARIFFMARGA